jgi:hypothetical protein
MQFRTQIPIPKSNQSIDYNSKIVSLGSCFAVNMAQKLDYFKFQNTCNPFGILFHPLAIEKLIGFAVSQKEFTETDVFFHNERWHCFDAHSDLSNSSIQTLLQSLNQTTRLLHQQIAAATHIIITYGTSWVYRNIESNEIVANCHKVSQAAFSKEVLSVETIEKSIQNTLVLIRKINPNVSFIFTVSPVRHLKDGFVENQLSKAHLITALHLVLKVPPSGAEGLYFPSYEIMMDELRDYRFYAEDMIHPSQVAIDYIWERFKEICISENAYTDMGAVENIQKSLAHRPFNPDSEKHQQSLLKLQHKMDTLQKENPNIQF